MQFTYELKLTSLVIALESSAYAGTILHWTVNVELVRSEVTCSKALIR